MMMLMLGVKNNQNVIQKPEEHIKNFKVQNMCGKLFKMVNDWWQLETAIKQMVT
jgi:hypothetical protein